MGAISARVCDMHLCAFHTSLSAPSGLRLGPERAALLEARLLDAQRFCESWTGLQSRQCRRGERPLYGISELTYRIVTPLKKSHCWFSRSEYCSFRLGSYCLYVSSASAEKLCKQLIHCFQSWTRFESCMPSDSGFGGAAL